MADLTTYAGLIGVMQDFLGRSDMTTARADYCIDLTEAWMNSHLRAREMETTNGTLTVSAAGVITHPTDWIDWKKITRTTSGTRVQLQPIPSEGREFRDWGVTDPPLWYELQAAGTQAVPKPDATYVYEGIYYQKVPPLGPVASNWVLATYPDVYLYGALSMSESFYKDDSRIALWKQLFAESTERFPKKSQGGGQVPVMVLETPAC